MNNLNKIWDSLKKLFEKLSLKIWWYFFVWLIIYFIAFLYHFKPELFSFENLTIYFILYSLIFILYKREFFIGFLSSYLEILSISFKFIKNIMIYVIFFWIIFLYLWWEDLSLLNGSIFLFYLSSIFALFYDKNDRKSEFLEKYDLKSRVFYFNIFLFNIIIFLFIKKLLLDNNIKEIYSIIFVILFIFNLIFLYFFTNLFVKIEKIIIRNFNIFVIWSSVSIIFLSFIYLDDLQKLFTSELEHNKEIKQDLKSEDKRKVINKDQELKLKETLSNSGKIKKEIIRPEIKEIIFDISMFDENLWIWSKWQKVEILQKYLKEEWFFKSEINGIYDKNTVSSFNKYLTEKCGWSKTNIWILWPLARDCLKQNLNKQ